MRRREFKMREERGMSDYDYQNVSDGVMTSDDDYFICFVMGGWTA